jgi:hypothetical protein
LSENHIRGISATLVLLDKALCEFDHWAHGHDVQSVLYEIRNTLSRAQRELIAGEVAVMKALLSEMQSTLDLERSVRSVDHMISGSCSVLWASLVELESCRLRRYGDIPDGLAEHLEPRVAALNASLRRIAEAVAVGPRAK